MIFSIHSATQTQTILINRQWSGSGSLHDSLPNPFFSLGFIHFLHLDPTHYKGEKQHSETHFLKLRVITKNSSSVIFQVANSWVCAEAAALLLFHLKWKRLQQRRLPHSTSSDYHKASHTDRESMLVRKWEVATCLSLLLVKKMLLKKIWMPSKMIYLSKISPQCFSWAKLLKNQSNRLVDSNTGNNHSTLFPWCPIKSTVFFHRGPPVQNVVTLRMHTVVKTHHKIRHKLQQHTCRLNAKTSPSSRSCWTNFDGETH